MSTRLRCSACETPICPDCAHEAAVGYKCPACAAADAGVPERSVAAGLLAGTRGPAGARPDTPSEGELPRPVLLRAAAVGAGAALAGGLLMVPILLGGTLLLISSGVIGWGVARAVYWATAERNSRIVRGLALGLAGSTVLLAILVGGARELTGLEALALPAAVYGGWIVVRQR